MTIIVKDRTIKGTDNMHQDMSIVHQPDWRLSRGLIFAPSSGFLKMPKMEPMETRQSMLEEPSSGSNVTMYLPWWSSSTVISSSFSWRTTERNFK